MLLQEPRGHLDPRSHFTDDAAGPVTSPPGPHSQDSSPALPQHPLLLHKRSHVIFKSAKLVKSLAHFLFPPQNDMDPWPLTDPLPRGFLPYLKFLRQGPQHPESRPSFLEEESEAGFSLGVTFSWQRREGWRWLLAQNQQQRCGCKAWMVPSSQQAAKSTYNPKRSWSTVSIPACFSLFQKHSE